MLLHTFAKNKTEFTYLSNCQYNLLIKSHLNLITVQKNPNYKNIITPFNTWFWEFKYTQLELSNLLSDLRLSGCDSSAVHSSHSQVGFPLSSIRHFCHVGHWSWQTSEWKNKWQIQVQVFIISSKNWKRKHYFSNTYVNIYLKIYKLL